MNTSLDMDAALTALELERLRSLGLDVDGLLSTLGGNRPETVEEPRAPSTEESMAEALGLLIMAGGPL